MQISTLFNNRQFWINLVHGDLENTGHVNKKRALELKPADDAN